MERDDLLSAEAADGVAAAPQGLEPPSRLNLTDFLDLPTLREIQDSFHAVTRLATRINDADGRELADPADDAPNAASEALWRYLVTDQDVDGDAPFTAPIVVDRQVVGSITIEPKSRAITGTAADGSRISELIDRLHLTDEQARLLRAAIQAQATEDKAAAMRFVVLLATSIARLCYQQYQHRHRVEELSALYDLSRLLAQARDLQELLDTATRYGAEVLKAKAASLRLLDDKGELILTSAYNLSQAYLDKGPIMAHASQLNERVLAGGVEYVEDMATDPRVVYKDDARREGLVSFVSVGLHAKDRPIGVMRVYSGQRQSFNAANVEMLKAVSRLTATAIENARLQQSQIEAQRVKHQLHLASDVQRRMLPAEPPRLRGMDLAARFVPSFELGGDFYDFIALDEATGNTGLAIGDVVGKGVAASLLMAGVRSSLRAYAQDIYDLDEIMARVNIALTRDTLDKEFATIFYGVIDPHALRMTYCNAGHDPPLLLRRGHISPLDIGGMIVGIDEHQQYDKGVLTFEPGDLILFYTDGLIDAQNFDGKRFGRDRLMQAMRDLNPHATANDAVNHVLWSMRRHIGLQAPIDDTTLLALRIHDDAKPTFHP